MEKEKMICECDKCEERCFLITMPREEFKYCPFSGKEITCKKFIGLRDEEEMDAYFAGEDDEEWNEDYD